MHDPKVVAFDIRRPWPQRDHAHDAKPGGPRWKARYEWATWTRPWRGWMSFWTIAGRGLYWPSFITVWHCEPGGADALTVCRDRVQRPDGQWTYTRGWKWHVRHWKIQVHPLQRLRRALLTRCEECGRKGHPNVSHGGRERTRWWRGERGLYHFECSGLLELRRVKERDEEIIRALFAEIRVRTDETTEEALERIAGPRNGTLDFSVRYRLQRVVGADAEHV
jgi:hypothetical protein